MKRGRVKARAALHALMLGFAALFAAYYPPISGIEDETGFLNQALVWSRGAVSSEGAGFPHGLHDFIEVSGRHVPARHPGRSLLALPLLILGGTRATFVSGLALHLLATLAGAAIPGQARAVAALGRADPVPPDAGGLQPDRPGRWRGRSGLITGGARGHVGRAGLGGSGCRTRGHDALSLGARLAARRRLVCLPRAGTSSSTRPWRNALLCLLAGEAAGCLLVGYNLAVYGTPNEPFTKDRGFFSSAFVVPNAMFYATALLVLWPGMLFAPLLDRSRFAGSCAG